MPFVHAYSGFGSETENRDPAKLAQSRIHAIRGKIVELNTMASDMLYNFHAFSMKHYLIQVFGDERLDEDALKEFRPNQPNALSVLYLPNGATYELKQSELAGADLVVVRGRGLQQEDRRKIQGCVGHAARDMAS